MAKIGKSVILHTATTLSTVLANNEGFMVNADGTAVIQARVDAATVSLPVKAGIVYPIDCIGIDVPASSTLTSIWIVRAQEH